MVIWLVTVRAAEDHSAAVGGSLKDRLLPLLHAHPSCNAPTIARCVNCAGEYTYLAYWDDSDTVLSFEATPAYQAVLDDLAPLLRVRPKRELWEVLVRQE